MSVIVSKKEELQDMRTAKFIAGALRDISAIKIRSIRESFKNNKVFYNEISELYRLIKLHAARTRYDSERNILVGTSPKVLAVAVTSNKRFYGSLNSDVLELFLEYIKEKNEADSLVIGATGKQFLSRTLYEKRSEYITFTDDDPTTKEVDEFLSKTQGYNKVLVFYPRFINVFKQEPMMIDITYAPETERLAEEKIEGYIFEPELSEMVEFFETRIRHLLFKRTMLETELARTAARVTRMNSAEHKASELIEEKEHELKKEMLTLSSMRLLETFSGVSKWKKT